MSDNSEKCQAQNLQLFIIPKDINLQWFIYDKKKKMKIFTFDMLEPADVLSFWLINHQRLFVSALICT